MKKPKQLNWQQFNQMYLEARLAELKLCLTKKKPLREIAAYKVVKNSPQPAFEILCQRFDLTSSARQLLLFCIGIELDSDYAQLCASLTESTPGAPLTLAQVATVLSALDWQILTPIAPLRYWQLVEFNSMSSFMQSSIRVAERILHYLMGTYCLDEPLTKLLRPITAVLPLLPTWKTQVQQLAQLIQHNPNRTGLTLSASDKISRHTIAKAACEQLGLQLYELEIHFLSQNVNDLALLKKLLAREALLTNTIYLIEYPEHSGDNSAQIAALNYILQPLSGKVLISSTTPPTLLTDSYVNITVNPFTLSDQMHLWQLCLAQLPQPVKINLTALTQQFSLSAQQIYDITHELAVSGKLDQTKLVQICRTHLRKPLTHLCRIIQPTATWKDIALPEAPLNLLKEITAHVAQRHKVYQQWGFAAKSHRGLGISALFAGPTGTGKTLAAEILANALQLDLYHIDLSAIVSKYIGETEKNLKTIFDHAEATGAILLFDEADALFGKRSDVKDSHDRYANLEISYLLQRMESYQGLSILTTNLKETLDPAFMRRIRFVVEFPFPDQTQRLEIWQKVFPKQTPLQNMDLQKLSCLSIAGGNISSIALNAAFIAAGEDAQIKMDHVLHAVQREYTKLQIILTESEWKN